LETIRELYVFLRARNKIWLWPAMGMMLFLGALMALAGRCLGLASGKQPPMPQIQHRRVLVPDAAQPGEATARCD
jgi:hypothetical protein